MRTVLTILAVVLVALLTTALVAPLCIDWSRQRAFIEAELSRNLGAPVESVGPIEVRLLPAPYLQLARVTVGGRTPGQGPLFRCDGARFEMAIASLASGQLRFAGIELDRPRVELSLDADGTAPSPNAELAGLIARAGVDRLTVHDGRVVFRRGGGAPTVIHQLDFSASAHSFAGPYRGAGAATTPSGARVGFELASTVAKGGALPIKLELDDATSGIKAAFDGQLRAASAGAGWRPTFTGSATFVGALAALDIGGPSPWKITGALAASPDDATLDNLVVSVGSETRALEANGSADAKFGSDPSLTVSLQSKQLNVDSLLRGAGEDSAPPSRAAKILTALGGFVASEGAPSIRAEVTFKTPALFLGAETLEDASLALSSAPGEPLRGSLETGLPGRGRVKLDGAYEFGAAAEFRGAIDARVSDLGALGRWAAQGDADFAQRAKAFADALPYSEMSAKGELEATKVGFSVRNLTLKLDRTQFDGSVAFTQPLQGARGRLYVDLSSDALDIDEAPDFSAGPLWLGDFDLSIALKAARLSIARAGEATIESGSLALEANRTGDDFKLDHLSIAGLGGAAVEAAGEATPLRRWMKVSLDAARLADFADLVARVAPNRYSRLFAARAEALSPARLTLEARREGEPKSGAFPLDFLTAEGEVGGTHISLKVSDAPAPVNAIGVEASIDALDGGALMSQLGLKAPSSPLGKARASLKASGTWEVGFDAEMHAAFDGADATFKGRLTPAAASPSDPVAFGSATLKSDNLLPALIAFNLASSVGGVSAPVDLNADFVARDSGVAIPRLAGAVAGAKVAADLTWTSPSLEATAVDPDVAVAARLAGEAQPGPGGLEGEATLDRASAAALAMLALGPPTPAKPGARWSDANFAEPLMKPPRLDVKLKIGALDFGEGAQARNAEAEARLEPGKFELAEAAFDLGGAHLTGHATLRRDGPVAAVTGALDVQGLSLDRPALRGKLGASVEFATAAASANALISGLVGQGQVTMAGLGLPHLDPGALDRVMAKAQLPDADIDETNITHALQLELDKQPLLAPDGTAPLVLASGVARVGPVSVAGSQGRATVAGSFDLRSLEFAAKTDFELQRAGKFWNGPLPAISVSTSGPLDAPTRRIDDSILVAGLSSQAIARESDRISALEADIRERAFFNRVMKTEQYLDMRDREVKAYLAEQARLKMEDDRRRVEDALMKAYQDKLKAQAAPAAPPTPMPLAPSAARLTPQLPPPLPEAAAPGDPTASGLY